MKKYKVLSVRQPYASLLVSGVKDVENRSRKTNFRGTVLIHASAKEHDIVSFLKERSEFTVNEILILSTMGDVEDDNLFSCIIGSVDIVDCVQNHPSEWAEKGQWHWVCANAKKFKHPIRNVKGKLGIWEWEDLQTVQEVQVAYIDPSNNTGEGIRKILDCLEKKVFEETIVPNFELKNKKEL